MAMRYLGADVPIVNVNYDELAETIVDTPRDVQLFITDLSIPENISGLLEEFEYVVIVDHHKSTKWAIEWAKDKKNVEVVISMERCATYLFYEYLAKQYGYRDTIQDEWAKYVDDYDRYVLQYPESRRLNALFYISDKDRFTLDALQTTPTQLLDIPYNKAKVDRYLQNQEEYINKIIGFQLGDRLNCGHNIAIAFAEKNKSAYAEKCMKEFGMDLVYVVDMHNFTVSIRSTPESKIDCSKVAKMIHPEGGGHPNASGASLDSNDWIWNYDPEDKGLFPLKMFRMTLDFPLENLPHYTEEDE